MASDVQSSMRVRRRPRGPVVIAVVVTVCAVVVGGILVALGRHNRPAPHSSPQLVTLCPGPCGPGATGSAGSGAIRFAVPAGFSYSAAFRPARPLFSAFDGRYLRLNTTAGRTEVLAIVTYSLPAGLDASSSPARLAAVAKFNQVSAVALTAKPSATTVSGLPGVTQSGIQPITTASGTLQYSYDSWFLFLPTTLVQVTCQYLDNKTDITKGCQSLLGSITAV